MPKSPPAQHKTRTKPPQPRTVIKRLPDGTPVRVTIVDTRKTRNSRKGGRK